MKTANGYEFELVAQPDGSHDLLITDVAIDDVFTVEGMTPQELRHLASLLIQAADAQQEGE